MRANLLHWTGVAAPLMSLGLVAGCQSFFARQTGGLSLPTAAQTRQDQKSAPLMAHDPYQAPTAALATTPFPPDEELSGEPLSGASPDDVGRQAEWYADRLVQTDDAQPEGEGESPATRDEQANGTTRASAGAPPAPRSTGKRGTILFQEPANAARGPNESASLTSDLRLRATPGNVGQPLAAEPEKPLRPSRIPSVESVSILPAAGDADQSSRPRATSAANQPRGLAPAAESAASVADRISALEQAVRKNPNNIEAQWRLRMLYLAEGLDAKAADIGPEVNPETAVMLRRLLELVAGAKKGGGDPAAIADHAYRTAGDFLGEIERYADLQIPVVEFCSYVKQFGVYDVIEPGSLINGKVDRVIVYCEIVNFASERTPKGEYLTRLKYKAEIFDQIGRSHWTDREQEESDLCRNKRRDFCLAWIIPIPTSLQPGDYVLKVSVTDTVSRKTAETIRPFKIVGG